MPAQTDFILIRDGTIDRWQTIAESLGEAGSAARVKIAALHWDASLHSLERAAKAVHHAVTRLTGDDAKVAAALLAEIDALRVRLAA